MRGVVCTHRVLRPPGGGSSITIGDDTPPPPQKVPARSPYAVEGDGVINPNKSAKDYTPSKPFGTEEDRKSSPQVSQKYSVLTLSTLRIDIFSDIYVTKKLH